MPFYWKERDYSHPSEAAKLRMAGVTRIHCEDTYDGESKAVELDLGRGSESDEDACDMFNQRLRAGHEHLRR